MIYLCLLLVLVYTTVGHYHNPYLNHNINYFTNRLSIIPALYYYYYYYYSFKDLIHLLYIDRDSRNIIMSVLREGCRKTQDNEEFGLKTDGNQCRTYIKCRNMKIKKIEEEEEETITCCDVELIRDTFRKLNCRIVYLKELKYMMDLYRNVARSNFSKMVVYNNIAIIETITSDSFCFLLNLLEHIGFHANYTRIYDINVVIHKCSADKIVKLTSTSDKNLFDGFMNCLKLPNKKMCDTYL